MKTLILFLTVTATALCDVQMSYYSVYGANRSAVVHERPLNAAQFQLGSNVVGTLVGDGGNYGFDESAEGWFVQLIDENTGSPFIGYNIPPQPDGACIMVYDTAFVVQHERFGQAAGHGIALGILGVVMGCIGLARLSTLGE